MEEEKNQPQDAGTQEVEQPEETQVAEPTEEVQPGAEETPQAEAETPPPPERAYTQAEWSKRESELNKQISELQKQSSQMQLEKQIAELEQHEKQSREKDQKDVDEGVITQAEASQRQQQRQNQLRQRIAFQQQMQGAQKLMAEAEQMGRVLAAQDFGKKYKLSDEQVTELLSDKEISTPQAMEAKAANLALEKTQGELKKAQAIPQRFDQGQMGSAGAAIDDMSPEEKIRWGLVHPLKKKSK